MSSTHLNYLITTLRSLPALETEPLLQSEKIKKSGYERLSELIHKKLSNQLQLVDLQKLGSSISPRTLTKIFNGNYPVNGTLDPRTKNTLDKLSIFADFKNWEHVKSSMEKEWKKSDTNSDLIKKQILHALAQRQVALSEASEQAEKALESYFTKKGSAYKKLMAIHHTCQERGWQLSNKYNPSTIDILDCEVQEEGDTAKITTQESWIMCWWSELDQRYVYRYQRNDQHLYTAKKTKSGWKLDIDASNDSVLDTLIN